MGAGVSELALMPMTMLLFVAYIHIHHRILRVFNLCQANEESHKSLFFCGHRASLQVENTGALYQLQNQVDGVSHGPVLSVKACLRLLKVQFSCKKTIAGTPVQKSVHGAPPQVRALTL
jgi:hypothetical protein